MLCSFIQPSAPLGEAVVSIASNASTRSIMSTVERYTGYMVRVWVHVSYSSTTLGCVGSSESPFLVIKLS